ncbi:MAG: reprolysin-like metallopeptidase, partial [Pyrinomonadaceae bacterium]
MKQHKNGRPALQRSRVGASVARRRMWLICGGLVLLLIGSLLWPGGERRVSAGENVPAGNAQRAGVQASEDGLWRESGQRVVPAAGPSERQGAPDSYRPLSLDGVALAKLLRRAPLEGTAAAAAARDTRVFMSLPLPDGSFARFRIVESPIMEPALAARFPDIKTYSGQGVDDPSMSARFDWTPTGLHAIVLAPGGTAYVEPDPGKETNLYRAYYQRDLAATDTTFQCDATEPAPSASAADHPAAAKHSHQHEPSPRVVSGQTLRTYRLAVAATAEYTNTYGGGTVAGALSAITTTINLVNAIYQREVGVRLVLVANEDSVIFTDAVTDGYTSDNVGAMLNENQARLDQIIGSANYDIGHVFDGRRLSGGFSFQGVAAIGAVCVNGRKGRGATALRSVQPSSIFAYYIVAHEIGHQFSATHTFNGMTPGCGGQRTASTAYEPGSGSTIMAYRFNCGAEDLRSNDTYFHNASLEQIVNYTTNGNGACATQTPTGNNAPNVDAGPVYTIPQGTPFTLNAAGSDPEGDALTYCWEQFDLGAPGPPNTDDGSRPIFRSFAPTAESARTFPRLFDVLFNRTTFGESLPTTTRTLNFRVTARDNRADGGGIASDATQINVRADSGPFVVTQPASGFSFPGNSAQSVMWNVANTAGAPVGAASVRISLSTDDGNTFPVVLADNTPNDGAETVTLPDTTTFAARVKVEAVGNVFFNISDAFRIMSTPCTFTINPPGLTAPAGGGSNTVNVTTASGCNWTVVNSIPWLAISGAGGVNAGSGSIVLTLAANTGSAERSGFLSIAGQPFIVTQAGQPQSAATVQFGTANYHFGEGEARATITVTRAGDASSGPVSVDYATADDPAPVPCDPTSLQPNGQPYPQGTAYARCDYATTLDTVTFAAGDAQPKTITIPLVNDAHVEGPETLQLRLSNPRGATLGATAAAILTITDDDATAGVPNPVDASPFFVRQQYLDFLSREPEPDGFQSWLDTLNGCPDPFN